MKEFNIEEAKKKASELRKQYFEVVSSDIGNKIIQYTARNEKSFMYTHFPCIYPGVDMQAVIDYFKNKNIFIKYIKENCTYPMQHEYLVDISAMFD